MACFSVYAENICGYNKACVVVSVYRRVRMVNTGKGYDDVSLHQGWLHDITVVVGRAHAASQASD